MKHQYVDRTTGSIATEKLFGDRIVSFLYSEIRESAPSLFRLMTQQRISDLLAKANFDMPLGSSLLGNTDFLRSCGVDLSECVALSRELRTPRQIFERKIRYWNCRPMPDDPTAVVSPADSRVVVGSLAPGRLMFVKNKFFECDELLGLKTTWSDAFRDGDFSIFRLTPDKYHYTHLPCAGVVKDYYEVAGDLHSCNPGAVVEIVTPYSKNRRSVTIIDTDAPNGTGVGLVAMIEVAALMIGEIVQCYSTERYDDPRMLYPGLRVEKGSVKALFRPGSSAIVLLFQHKRIDFAPDLAMNVYRAGAESRFSHGFSQPLLETDIKVRSLLATRKGDRS